MLRSAALRNRTWLSSTFRFEARSRYKDSGPVFNELPEAKEHERSKVAFRRLAKQASVRVPWGSGTTADFSHWLLPPSEDSFAIAPRRLFALMPYSSANAVTHLTASRGFKAKVSYLKSIGKWLVNEQADEAALTARAAARGAARDARPIAGRLPSTGRDRRSGLANQTAGHKYRLSGTRPGREGTARAQTAGNSSW